MNFQLTAYLVSTERHRRRRRSPRHIVTVARPHGLVRPASRLGVW